MFDSEKSAVSGTVHVLLLSTPERARKMLAELTSAGLESAVRRVQTNAQLEEALDSAFWDVAICDDGIPDMDGPSSLRRIKRAHPELPVIMISSSFGESVAAAAMKGGADDFLAQGMLARLAPAVEREIRLARARRGWEHANRNLKEAEARINAFLDNSPAVAFMKDDRGRMVYVNRVFEKVFGLSLDEIRGKTDGEWLPAETAAQLSANDEAVLRAGATVEFEEAVPAPDGLRQWSVFKFPFRDASGATFVGGMASDVTERKVTEVALRASEALHRELIEHGQVLLCTHDLEGRILAVNANASRSLGYEHDLFPATLTIPDILAPETRAAFPRYLEKIRETGAAAGVMVVRTRDGNRRYWEYRNTVKTETGKKPVVHGLSFDITDRIKAEEALEEARQFSEQIIANAGEGIVVYDADLRYRLWNRFMEELTGLSKERVLGRGVSEVFPDEEKGAGDLLVRAFAGEKVVSSPTPFRVPETGRSGWVTSTFSPHRNSQGQIVGVIGIVEDVTERKRLEEQFLQAQKMEAIGRLAGGIAHDFNNLLTAILGYSDLLLSQFSPGDPSRGDLEEIQKAGERAASLTRQLLAFSRQQMLEPKVLDLNALLVNLQRMLRRLIGEDIAFTGRFDPELGPVRADPVQIEQAILNLAVNSRDAMPRGGELVIETRNVLLEAPMDLGRAAIQPGRYSMIEVRDTGTGIDPAVRDRIFEPFFTTKEKGKGTGLGLATAYGIVQQSGGHILCESEPGQGTRFRIYLPTSGGVPDAPPKPEARPARERGHSDGSVLLVEDEDGVRRLCRKLLESEGYEVIEAANGAQALELVRTRDAPLHLLLTDVIMPGLTGPQLAERVHDLRPDIRTLYMSGYTDAARTELGDDAPLIQKPFTPETLVERVRGAMAGGGSIAGVVPSSPE